MAPRARLVGFNHVALVVGDLEEALEFEEAPLRDQAARTRPGMAFIDAGDQLIALSEAEKESVLEELRRKGLAPD